MARQGPFPCTLRKTHILCDINYGYYKKITIILVKIKKDWYLFFNRSNHFEESLGFFPSLSLSPINEGTGVLETNCAQVLV